jgi:DNA-binding MarR family transcriptional regulator
VGEPEVPIGELAADMRLVVGRIVRKLRLTKALAGDLALPEASVLARLDRDGPSSPSALAAAEGVRPQAMAATLTALDGRGLLVRSPDATDGRRAVVTISPAGRALVVDRRSRAAQRLATVISTDLTPSERSILLAALPVLDKMAERL